MGQKVSPIGMRIGINKDWSSKWYAEKKDFAGKLGNDIKIRDFNEMRRAGLISLVGDEVVNPYIGYTNAPAYISKYLLATILFGDPKPQLQFTTAPPTSATIKIEAYCDYPIKNENWIIENSMTFDYKITRL